MADTYTYKVKDKGGKVLQGELEADSVTLVANRLRQMGYVPLAIDKSSANAGLKKELKIPGFGGNKVASRRGMFLWWGCGMPMPWRFRQGS